MQLTRRAFAFGAVAAPIVAKADLLDLNLPANLPLPVPEPLPPASNTLLSICDSNMAFQRWRSDFMLDREDDGTFALRGRQTFDDADDGEPWDLGPARGLESGEDIYHAMQGMLSEFFSENSCPDLDGVADILKEMDRDLAVGFRRAEIDMLAEYGFDE